MAGSWTEGYDESPEGSRNDPVSFSDVEERMIEAIGFLDRCTRSGRNPFAADGPWSQVIKDRAVDYVWNEEVLEQGARERGGLTPAEYDRMTEALDWIRFVPARAGLRTLVGIVLIMRQRGGTQVDWLEVKRRLRRGDTLDALRMSYSRSITAIARRLSH